LNWLAGVIRSGSDFDIKTWGQSAADWMDEEIASYWGDMTSGNVLADEYIGWIQSGAMHVTDLGRYGTSVGEAAHFTEGDLLDRLSVGSRDLVRGGEMLAMLARAVNKAGVGKTSTPKQGEKVYRVFGENNNPMGESWTPVDPNKVKNFRLSAGLPDSNTGRFVVEGTIKDTSGITVRKALPLNGNLGGLQEYVIPDAKTTVIINRVSGVNPEF
jgi:hypothetical protein